MVDVTLKQGVEVMMKESVPDIVAIHDATDHDSGSNPYYSRIELSNNAGRRRILWDDSSS